jgi:hypothetical protein
MGSCEPVSALAVFTTPAVFYIPVIISTPSLNHGSPNPLTVAGIPTGIE